MMNMALRIGFMVFALLAATLGQPLSNNLNSRSTDWPQWRGPNRDGKSGDQHLLQEWPEGGPPLAWKAEGIGAGFSSVSLSNGRVFTMVMWMISSTFLP
jgi:hypothetical protein